MGNRSVCPTGTSRCAFPIACPRDAHCRIYGLPLRDRDGISFQEPPLDISVQRPTANRAVHDVGTEIHEDSNGTAARDIQRRGLFADFVARPGGIVASSDETTQSIRSDGRITIRRATCRTLCFLWGEI